MKKNSKLVIQTNKISPEKPSQIRGYVPPPPPPPPPSSIVIAKRTHTEQTQDSQ